MTPAGEQPVVRCDDCDRPLKDPASRRRKVGPICLLKRRGAWLLRWHHHSPRYGRLQAFDMDGEAGLFEAQPTLPTEEGGTR